MINYYGKNKYKISLLNTLVKREKEGMLPNCSDFIGECRSLFPLLIGEIEEIYDTFLLND